MDRGTTSSRLEPGIVPLEEELARIAGELNFERKKRVKGWGMADSIVLATARRSGSKIVTGDSNFKDLAGETLMLNSRLLEGSPRRASRSE